MSSSYAISILVESWCRRIAQAGEETDPETQAAVRLCLRFLHISRTTRLAVLSINSSLVDYYMVAARVMHDIFSRQRNVLIHGSGGVGKTSLTARLYAHARDVYGPRVAMIAPTQAAAELLTDGVTIHSFLGLKKTMMRAELEDMHALHRQSRSKHSFTFARRKTQPFPKVAFMDEISMVGVKLLYNMDFVMRRRPDCIDENEMFGGCRVVMVGDFCQLPPVADAYAFEWPLWPQLNVVVHHLTKPLRQDNDRAYFNYLQAVRSGAVKKVRSAPRLSRAPTNAHLQVREGNPNEPTEIDEAEYTRLMTLEDVAQRPLVISALNDAVEQMNTQEFARIPAAVELTVQAHDVLARLVRRSGAEPSWRILDDEQPTPADLEKIRKTWRLQVRSAPGRCRRDSRRTQEIVELKAGARYVITINLCKKKGIYNGRTCVYEGDGWFRLSNGDRVPSALLEGTHCVATHREADLYIMRRQLALRLGYAQTIHRVSYVRCRHCVLCSRPTHKTQGMTLDKVIVDLRTLRFPGQYYVAMSRTRRREHTYIIRPTDNRILHSDRVLEFLKSTEMTSMS